MATPSHTPMPKLDFSDNRDRPREAKYVAPDLTYEELAAEVARLKDNTSQRRVPGYVCGNGKDKKEDFE
jgi:hypothetical protein